jgi:hypothetical protein
MVFGEHQMKEPCEETFVFYNKPSAENVISFSPGCVLFNISSSGCRIDVELQDAERIKILRGFSPPANYTDRATAACRRS